MPAARSTTSARLPSLNAGASLAFLLVPLSQSDSGAAAVLVDELDHS
jgi:hypothetical protein